MDPVTLLDNALTSLGYGAYVPVVLATVGLASAIAKVYPVTWPGGKWLHVVALNPTSVAATTAALQTAVEAKAPEGITPVVTVVPTVNKE